MAMYPVSVEDRIRFRQLMADIERQLETPGGSLLDPARVIDALEAILVAGSGEIAVFSDELSGVITLDPERRFDPKTFLGAGWEFCAFRDIRTVPLREIYLRDVRLRSVFFSGEQTVLGDEVLRRLVQLRDVLLGADLFQHFLDHPEAFPESWKRQRGGKPTTIAFFGSPLRSAVGNRCVLCLSYERGGLQWRYSWLSSELDTNTYVVTLSSR